jgi:hypothetical protein
LASAAQGLENHSGSTRGRAVTGKVRFVAPPPVNLTLPDGQNKQYTVRDEDNVRFMFRRSKKK